MIKSGVFKLFLISTIIIIAGSNNLASVYAELSDYENKLIKTIEIDTTGDKIKDTVKISANVDNEDREGYAVGIEQHGGKRFKLTPANEFKYLAPYTPFWNLNIKVLDVNNDSVPEIITWGDMSHENIIHVFRWDGSNYKIIYSGFNTGFYFEDITGDGIPELVIGDRIYGTGHESTYFQWQKKQYKKIYYEVTACRGFDRIRDILGFYSELQANEKVYSSSYFESLFKGYFTKEWFNSESNKEYIKEFGKDLFSIQITKYINDKLEFDSPGDIPTKDTWKFKVLAYKIENTRIVPKEMIMTVVTKPVGDNNDYKIDYINFSEGHIDSE